MPSIRDLQERRTELGAQARAIMDDAEAAGRAMSADEEQTFDRLLGERDQVDSTIARAQRLREDDRTEAERAAETERTAGSRGTDTDQQQAFRSYLLGGRAALTPEQARALNMASDPEGGFLVAPQEFVAQLLQNVDDAVDIRRLATVQQLTTAESLGVPTLDTDLADAEWTTEIGTGSQDDALRFGKRELRPNPMAKRVLISRTLLRRATLSPEQIVRERMAYKFGVTAEKAYMTGDGNKKPLGVFTASADGIPTSRDVATGSATGFTGDGLIDAKYALKAAYYKKAQWLFHRDAIKLIRKLRDDSGGAGVGNYIWQAGLSADRPDTILDLPYNVNEFVPNTFTTGQYVGMLGDFSYYWIADSLALEVQRLVELYAEANRIGFIGRLETDGMPVKPEAFVRLKTT
ncbi:phage major capsid protein [Kitasatospora sp. MBT63]|uniref:phage major capsid protein n=1 Tax=Kitasatospora sp. MBT63 TaxID=1444768 RepID=UPI00068923FA|nr:phage major capsid protein [Kitasatospora sp. MBT63]